MALDDETLQAVGSVAPLVPGAIGCVVIRPDRSRYLTRVMADPTAQEPERVARPRRGF